MARVELELNLTGERIAKGWDKEAVTRDRRDLWVFLKRQEGAVKIIDTRTGVTTYTAVVPDVRAQEARDLAARVPDGQRP